jgi:hypothetical protein
VTDRDQRRAKFLAGEPGAWATRLVWLLLPFTAGPAFATALDGRSDPVRTTASFLLWGLWTSALAASLVPRTTTLTAIRIVVPAAVPATVWATTVGAPADISVGSSLAAVISSVVVFAAVMSPLTGDAFVNGSSYGPERRFALRVPGALLAGPVAVAWAAVVVGVVGGPLLLAAGQWVAGAVAVAAAIPVGLLAVRALHGLSRRWVVFVPAGFVLHDPFTLVEPVLATRRSIAALGAALDTDTDTDIEVLDATAGAPGLALCLEVRDALSVGVKERGGRASRERTARKVLFTPTRPGALLHEATRRRLPIG